MLQHKRLYFMRVNHDSIIDTDNLEALRCPICIDCREGEKPECLEKNPQSTGAINCGTRKRNIAHQAGLLSVVRHNPPTACATCT